MRFVRIFRFLPCLITLLWLSGDAAGLALLTRGHGLKRTSGLEDPDQVLRAIESKILSGRPESPGLPIAKEDTLGRVWVAWEEWGNNRSRIGVGRYFEGQVIDARLFGRPEEFALSPDLSLDRSGSPWIIWVISTAREERVCVVDLSSLKKWTFRPAPDVSITNPRILVDRFDSVWVFWNETGKDRGEIIYRVLERGQWSDRQTIPHGTRFPCLNPDVAVDGQGVIWVVWSGYDGDDYELYLTRGDGTGWQKEARLTDNRLHDGFPSLGSAGDALVVSWTRTLENGSQVLAMVSQGGRPGGEIVLSPPSQELIFPRVFPAAGEQTSVIWRTGPDVVVREFVPAFSGRGEAPAPSTPVPPLIFNPQRNEDAYIGFGDSITYGYIDRLPTPELGYPPRLDILLDQTFGPTEMINAGLGGEATPAGLSRIEEVIAATDARYILIMEGTNDVINPPISMDTAAFNIQEMARKCLEAGLFPTVATIVPRHDWLGVMTFYHKRLLHLNDQIRQVAAALPVSFVDMYTLFNEYPDSDGGVLSLLSGDLKHPSEKGYQFMAEAWLNEIRNYPFPPVDIHLRRKTPKRDSFDVPLKTPFRFPERRLPVPSRKIANLLFWRVNPKIFDPSRIQGYKIYRLTKGEPAEDFSFFVLVQNVSRFMDGGLEPFEQYVYLISTLRDDGVEGPCSGLIDQQ
jgi:lysophospholipase L1-like esterase